MTAQALGLDAPASTKKRAVGLPEQSKSEPVYIRYTPVSGASVGSGSEITQRLVRIQDAPIDPLAPPTGKRTFFSYSPLHANSCCSLTFQKKQ